MVIVSIEDSGGADGVTLKHGDRVIARGHLTVHAKVGENVSPGTPVNFPLRFVGTAGSDAEDD